MNAHSGKGTGKKAGRSPLHLLAIALSFHLVGVGAVQSAHGGMVTTEQFTAARNATNATNAQERVATFLARDDVQAQLVAMGVDPGDAAARVAALTPQELASLDQRIADMPAGGVIAVIGVVFLVLLILELVGVTNVFTKI